MAAKNLVAKSAHLLTYRNMSIFSFFTRKRENNLWTSDNIVKSPHKEIEIPNRTIPEHIWENLDRWGDKTALVSNIYFYHDDLNLSRILCW